MDTCTDMYIYINTFVYVYIHASLSLYIYICIYGTVDMFFVKIPSIFGELGP